MTFIVRISLLPFVFTSLLISATAIQQDVPRPLRKRVEYCDDVKYGRPTFDDCLIAWMVLPYYDDVHRQFVSVPVDAPIHEVGAPVQLPLIRGFQSCRIAVTNPVAPSGGPTEDEGTWTDVRIATQGVLQWCVAEGLKGGTDEVGHNRRIQISVYETGSLFDREYPSYPFPEHLLEDVEPLPGGNPSSGGASVGDTGAASQNEAQTPAGQFPAQVELAASHALQCSAMYCAKGGLCCKGYTCSSTSVVFTKVLDFILLGIQGSIAGLASRCVPV